MTSETLLVFPCDFPLKVMGHSTGKFQTTVVEIVNRHSHDSAPPTVRTSRDDRYVALSFTIKATSREQLDALYHELTAHELVLFVL